MMWSQTVENDSSQIITSEFDRNADRKDIYRNSVTAGLTLGYGVEAKFGVNFAGGKVTKNIEFNFSYTHAWEKEVGTSWRIKQNIPNAPHSTTEVSWFLDKERAKCNFRATIAISGAAAIWFRKPVEWFDGGKAHNLWFPNPGMIVQAMRPPGFEDDGFRANFRARGVIDAEVGLRSRLSIKQRLHNATAADPTNTVEYLLNSEGKVLQG
jgi:hypothetical protein